MKQEPVAWAIKSDGDFTELGFDNDLLEEVEEMYAMEGWKYEVIPLYTAPRELSDEEIDAVIYELRQKSFDPERWVDVYTVAIETIIQLRDELAILKKASEK
jgi:hypothetical protein